MGNIQFTDRQKDVIKTSDKNILVSAAAGSGKTTVLVERIIQKITRKDNPVRIDKILVLTFSTAAAAQMREKIEEAIDEQICLFPEDDNLARQAVLLHNAQITTIHSFCMSVLRNHFEEAGIDPAFHVAESGEIALLEGKAVDELVADLFETGEVENFEMLADRFFKKNSTAGLKEVILNLYHLCRNAPFFDEYLEERRQDYEVKDGQNTPWMQYLCEQTQKTLRELIDETQYNIERSKEEGGAYGYTANLENDLELLKGAAACNGYESYYNYFSNKGFEHLSTKRMPDVDEEEKERAKDARKAVKASYEGIAKMFAIPMDTMLCHMEQNNVLMNILVDVLHLLDRRISKEKDKRKIVDFGDMEHLALSILVSRKDGVSIPTKAALEYADFYDEIMVDEYQDSNRIQEEILEAISGKVNSRFNRFMVGDVKQSIYKFRNACPEIFVGKYDSYINEDNCVRIDLSDNYRSRAEVIDGVNYVFERIMDKDLGMISYDSAARLYQGAKYPETDCDNSVELLICEDEKSVGGREKEAIMVALRICDLLKNHKVYDKQTDKMRPCTYKDIVVLFRAYKDWADVFKRVFERYGIPAFSTESHGYFDSSEIAELMNLLTILDNPCEDIPLYGIMTGYFGNFTKDDTAAVSSCRQKNASLYETVKGIADGTIEQNELITCDIIDRCRKFLGFVEKWRAKRTYSLIHVLLSDIIEETGYMHKIGSLPMGEQRRANVEMLIEKAKTYEAGSFKGLFHFIRYIDKVKEYKIDFGEASLTDEQADVVRLMTIHKSKGLEFPICFVCGTGKKYSNQDIKNNVVFESNLGVGFRYVDVKKNVSYPDVRMEVLKKRISLENAAEEMRILYVAMTRAKEKLILTGSCKETEDILKKYAQYKGTVLLPYGVRSGANSYLELLLAVISTGDSSVIKTKIYTPADEEEQNINEALSKEERRMALYDAINNSKPDDSFAQVMDRITYVYPYSNLENLYTKTSVSELKIAAIEEKLINHELEGITDEFFTEKESKAYVPDFVEKRTEVKGTARGSAYHRMMELFDFASNESFADLSEDMQNKIIDSNFERVVESGLMDAEDVRLVSREKIRKFMASNLGRRMCVAAAGGKLHLEEPFVLEIGADRLNSSFPKEEKVLIQGIIDVFFEEDGKLILMDYKTDRVDFSESLIERYRVQLDYYKEALERICEKTVAEKLIYSFALEETISVS